MDKVRLATIIDCEGSIELHDIKYKDRKENYKRPFVQATQKIKWYVRRFKNDFGFGGVYPVGIGGWRYEAYHLQALIICLILKNNLELKRENAENIIAYYEERLRNIQSSSAKRLITEMAKYSLEYKDGRWIYRGKTI